MSHSPRPLRSARRQQGLSLVEMMVGITVGLFVVAAAATLMVTQLTNNRRLLTETQIQQDMRVSLDIIARQIRRVGVVLDGDAENLIAPAAGSGGFRNPYAPLPTLTANEIKFRLYLNVADQGPFGFKLENGVVRSLFTNSSSGAEVWQDLTDGNTLEVTAFTITPKTLSSNLLPCPKLCPGGGTACWPRVEVRSIQVSMTARARSDATVVRTLNNEVRLRNDWVRFNNGSSQTAPACPA